MSDPVARSDRLDAQIEDHDPLAVLFRLGRQHRRIIRILSVVVVVQFVLAGALGYGLWRANQAAHNASSLATQARIACNAANDQRAGQRRLWSFVLSFPPPPDETSAERTTRLTETARFRAYIQKLFAPRNCRALSVAAAARASAFPTPAPTGLPSPTPAAPSTGPGVAVTPGQPASGPPGPPGSPGPRGHPGRPATQSGSPSPPTTSSPSPAPSPVEVCVEGHCIRPLQVGLFLTGVR